VTLWRQVLFNFGVVDKDKSDWVSACRELPVEGPKIRGEVEWGGTSVCEGLEVFEKAWFGQS